MKRTCPKCNAELQPDFRSCPYCGIVLEDTPFQAPPATISQPGMKWFKFIIYFQLFAAAVLNSLTAVCIFTGTQYTTDVFNGESFETITAEFIYSVYPGLHTADMMFAVFALLTAAAAIYVRQQLAHFRPGAPKKFLLYLLISLLGSVLYAAATCVIMADFSVFAQNMPNLIATAALLVINCIYFKKRTYLFVS